MHNLQNLDASIRRKAIWELGQRGNSDAISPLVELMIHVDSQQRSLILGAIAEISIRTLQPMSRALMISLQDESAEVRKNAIRDTARVYDLMAQVSAVLRYAVDDENQDVRETAHWAMEQLNRMKDVPLLEEAKRQQDP